MDNDKGIVHHFPKTNYKGEYKMSEILNSLGSFIDKFKELYNHIETLENNQNKNIEYDVYEIEIPKEPVCYIYSPSVYYIGQPKCDKCDDKRLVAQTKTITNNFKMCDCSKLLPFYRCDVIPVYKTETVNDCDILYTMENGRSISINGSFVLDEFNIKDLKVNAQFIYYYNKKDCEQYCNIMNKENNYEI